MAESVDASVSNTDGETRPGSTPGLGTLREEVNASLSPLILTGDIKTRRRKDYYNLKLYNLTTL